MASSGIRYSSNKAVTTTSAGGSHSGPVSIYNLSLIVEETSYDVATNASVLTLTGVFKVTNKGWNPAFTGHTVTFTTKDSDGNTVDTKTISSAYYGTNYTSCNKTLTVIHDNDGSKNVSYTTTISCGSTWYLPKSGSFVTTAGALTSIPRGTTFTVNTEVNTGLDEIITLNEPAVPTYKHSLYYILDGTRTDVKSKTDADWTTATISWTQIKNQIGTNVTKKMSITVETYLDADAVDPLDSRTKEITVSTGRIPISWRDDGVGGVGVTLGAKAESNGFSVQMDTTFGTSTQQQNVDFTNATVTGLNLGIQIEQVWSGASSSGTWNNFSSYKLYILYGQLDSGSGSRYNIIAPASLFGNGSSNAGKLQMADDSNWAVYNLYYTDDTGHFSRASNSTGASTYGRILQIWGIK